MYQVFKSGRTSIRRAFTTYEDARQAVRKLIRANDSNRGLWNGTNPDINFFGYSIKRVAPRNDTFWF